MAKSFSGRGEFLPGSGTIGDMTDCQNPTITAPSKPSGQPVSAAFISEVIVDTPLGNATQGDKVMPVRRQSYCRELNE